ncbi:helix-turn-helix domain-containing protein [Sphingomonas olei]
MKLLTAKQVAERYGLPSARTVITMRRQGLSFIRISKEHLFDPADVENFLKSKKETQCRDVAGDRTLNIFRSGAATTSSGARMASQGGEARARQIAERLKRHSPASSRIAGVKGGTEAARSIQLN